MDKLQEERMVNAHQLGRSDYREGKPESPPASLSEDERDCYVAGYRRADKRLTRATVAAGSKPTWYGQYRDDVNKAWCVVRNSAGHPIAYASEQAALDGAEFTRTRPTGRWMK